MLSVVSSVATRRTTRSPLDPRVRVPTTARLDDWHPSERDRLWGWLTAVGMMLLAFVIRLVNIERPNKLVFDETYYAKDAWALLNGGYERDWVEKANDLIVQGNVAEAMKDTASFVVHPPLGKWLIAWGEQLFGMNSFGWRFSSLVAGSILVFLVVRMARRLSRSTLIGAIAGFLVTIDGLSFVMSRIALLDIFQATFAVAGVSCVLADRDYFRRKLADYLRDNGLDNLGGQPGPAVWWRPWRLAAGVLFGLSIACKWNSLYLLAAMGIYSVAMDWAARRTAGAGKSPIRGRWWLDSIMAFIYLVIAAVPAYLVTWVRWLQVYPTIKWGWSGPSAGKFEGSNFEAMAALLDYHKRMFDFHTGDFIMGQSHTYEAHPIGWLVVARPIGIDAVNDIKPGTDGCEAVNDTCIRVISGMGTPTLWWVAALALIAAVIWWLVGRDYRFGVPVVAVLSIWLPWFPAADRPEFFFYAIMLIPFTATILAMAFGKLLGPADGSKRRRHRTWLVGGLIALFAANFWFIYPILTDALMTRSQWNARMWFRTWI